MRLDAYLVPTAFAPSALAGSVVVVVDVLRASTTIVTALAAGARSVIPFAETEDVVRTARHFARGEVVLAGAGLGDDLLACGAIDAQPIGCRSRDQVIVSVPVAAATAR